MFNQGVNEVNKKSQPEPSIWLKSALETGAGSSDIEYYNYLLTCPLFRFIFDLAVVQNKNEEDLITQVQEVLET